MTIIELLQRSRADWDTEAPPEYPPRPFEWYMARAGGRLDEYERDQPVVVIDPED